MKHIFNILLLGILNVIVFSSLLNTGNQHLIYVHIEPENLVKGDMFIFNLKNLDMKKKYTLEIHLKKIDEYEIAPKEGITKSFFGIPFYATDNMQLVLKENNIIIWNKLYSLGIKETETTYLKVDSKFIKPAEDFIKRIENEQKLTRKIKNTFTKKLYIREKPEFPINYGKITTPFGYKRIFNKKKESIHYGIDIGAPMGEKVLALFRGKVIFSGNLYYSGNTVFLDHGKGLVSMYAHLSKIKVRKNHTVKAGKVIGKVGKTGRVTGPHLHLGFFVRGVAVDPLSMFLIMSNLQ